MEDLLQKQAIDSLRTMWLLQSNLHCPQEGRGLETHHKSQEIEFIPLGPHQIPEGHGKIDLKDAYLTVPIARKHWKYLRFTWKGKRFQFSSLPFGLARTFTKLLRPVATRWQGLRVVFYIDDILLMADMVNMLDKLGFVLNPKKWVRVPRRSQLSGLQRLKNTTTSYTSTRRPQATSGSG